MKFKICMVLLLLFFNCKKENDSLLKNKSEVKIIETKSEIENNDVSSLNEIKFVSAKSGLNVRNENDSIIGKLAYNSRIEIISYSKELFEINDEGKVIKASKAKIKFNNSIGYVFSGFLSENISYSNKFYEIESFRKDEKGNNFQSGSEINLDAIFNIEIVSKGYYDESFSIITDFITKTEIRKTEDSIFLPLNNGEILEVIDKNVEKYEAEMQINSFIGEIQMFNSYLLAGSYYEWEDYYLIDKKNGERTITFEAEPKISPNKDYLVSIYGIYGASNSGIEIYKISDKNVIDFMYNFDFKNWGINYKKTKLKWINENEFIINVLEIDGYKAKEMVYLKFKIL